MGSLFGVQALFAAASVAAVMLLIVAVCGKGASTVARMVALIVANAILGLCLIIGHGQGHSPIEIIVSTGPAWTLPHAAVVDQVIAILVVVGTLVPILSVAAFLTIRWEVMWRRLEA